MPQESFTYRETREVFDHLEETSKRSGVSRAQAFEDFLVMSLASLSGGAMEEQYMQTVERHIAGEKGHRGCDSIADAFAALVIAMEDTRKDILGDLFQGAISYGEGGQFFTPDPVCELMARLTVEAATLTCGERQTACDPCCGSGRCLLAVSDAQPHWELVGQDIDLRCVRMTAINFALRNRYGYVIWGDTLRCEQRLVYRTGFNGRGFVREAAPEECGAILRRVADSSPASPETRAPSTSRVDAPSAAPANTHGKIAEPGKQLFLF